MSAASFSAYLNSISLVPLLTFEEELKYGRIIQSKKGSKSKKDKEAVANAIKLLAGANLRLVVKAASNYRNSYHDIEELTFEGNQGLLIAAERYDPSRGCRFSTYATWWIQQSIRLAVNNNHTIRTPVRRAALIAKIQGAQSFDPDADEQDTARLSKETGFSELEIRKLLRNRTQLLPLDAPIPDSDGCSTLQSAIPSNELSADVHMDAKETIQLLERLLDKLPPKHQEVIQLRFGLKGHTACTLDEISSRMGVTRERIRQIQQDGLQQLQYWMKQEGGFAIRPDAIIKARRLPQAPLRGCKIIPKASPIKPKKK